MKMAIANNISKSRDVSLKISEEHMVLLRKQAGIERRTIKAVIELAIERYIGIPV